MSDATTNRKAKKLLEKSSHGRFLATRLKLLRGGLNVLASVTPDAAATWAERLFLTPLKFPTPAVETAALAGGRYFSLRVRIGGRRVRLATWTFGEGPAVILAHGWGGRAGQMRHLIAPIVAAGFSVIAFDQPAHGRSSGKYASILDFAHALIEVDRQLGPAYAVIGHSLGGAAAALATSLGHFPAKLVTVGAPADADDWTREFAAITGLGDGVVARVRTRLERRYGRTFASLAARELGLPLNVDALVIHDEEDQDVAFRHAEALRRAWPAARFMATRGLGHRRVLRDAAVLRAILQFMGAAAAAAPRLGQEPHVLRDLWTGERLKTATR